MFPNCMQVLAFRSTRGARGSISVRSILVGSEATVVRNILASFETDWFANEP